MSGNLFSPRVAAAAVAAGMLAFVAFLWATAYAGEGGSGRDGGAHALSNAATGFRGLGDLLDATGGKAVRVRDKGDLRQPGLLVLTPTTATDPKLLASIVDARSVGRTLVIMPKWVTNPMKLGKKGWVSSVGPSHEMVRLAGALAKGPVTHNVAEPLFREKRRPRGRALSQLVGDFPGPRQVQTLTGSDLEPIVVASGSAARLVRLRSNPRVFINSAALVARLRSNPRVFIAADPDVFNNMGLADLATARAAIGLMDHMTEAADRRVTFDLTLNGFANTSNLLKLAFERPFGAATLCLLVAAALAALAAFFPFGPAIREARAISFGKRQLVANSADMILGASRDALVADRYADLIRDAAAVRVGLTPGPDAAAELDRLGTAGGKTYAQLAADVRHAKSRTAIAAAAAALHRWKKELA